MDEGIDDITLQAAARWHTRLRAVSCTEEERAAFARWQGERPLHVRAFALAQRTSARLDDLVIDERLQALAARVSTTTTDELGAERRRWMIPFSLAAALMLAVIGWHFSAGLLIPQVATVTYETPADQRRTVTLADGSTVELDVGTRIDVRIGDARRDIDLLAGRAMFEVTHDAARPFSVLAGGTRTTALGTRFQVQSEYGHVIVTLAEGSVAVANDRGPSWTDRLRPGEQLKFDAATAAVGKQTVDVQRTTSWLRGRHVFRDTPLAEAVEEVNRYAKTKIRLGDASLAQLPVGGSYIAGDSKLIVEALAAVLPIRAADGGDEIILFRRYQ